MPEKIADSRSRAVDKGSQESGTNASAYSAQALFE